MQLSSLDRLFWAAGFAAHAALLLVLLLRGRWKNFPLFTALVAFQITKTATLYGIYRYLSYATYAYAYWSAEIIDLLLQLALIFEIARNVLKPTGTWVRDARKFFVLGGMAGALLAAVIVWGVNPSSHPDLASWINKGNLFVAMVTCELFLAMRLASTQLGLVWRNHVMGLGQGYAVWAVVNLAVEAGLSYFGATWHVALIDHIRIATYLSAIVYWAIIFWLPEPESRKLSPDMQSYLLSLHDEARFGLRAVSSPRNHNT